MNALIYYSIMIGIPIAVLLIIVALICIVIKTIFKKK